LTQTALHTFHHAQSTPSNAQSPQAQPISNVMHKTRLTTFSMLVGSLFHAKFLSLTGLGRALKADAQERSAIRRVDRFLGNKRLQIDRLKIYSAIFKLVVGCATRPLIIVDWSPIPNKTDNVLRAAIVTSGRAITLYEEIHPQKNMPTQSYIYGF